MVKHPLSTNEEKPDGTVPLSFPANDHLSLLDADGKREEQSIKDLLLKGVVIGVQRAL